MEKILAQKLLSEATNFMAEGNYISALPKLALYNGIKPYNPIPLIYMGRCHLALNNLQTAKTYLSEAMERDPSNPDIAQLITVVDDRIERESLNGVIFQAKKILSNFTPEKSKEATDALKTILQKDPGNVWAKEKLSELGLLTSKSAEAENQKSVDKEGFKFKEKASKAISVISPTVLKYTIIILLIITIIFIPILRKKTVGRNYPLQGNINLIPILDIVSLINSNLKSGYLLVTTEKNKGEVFFEKGEIIHARYKADDGTSAFHKIMAIQSGRYVFNNHLPRVKQTIREPLSLLLLSMKSRNELFPSEEDNSASYSKTPV
jgi:tetratricopeptide (TPR) repeat protein